MKGSPRVIIRAPSGQWLLFANPVRVVRAQTAAGVRRALAEIEQAVQAGLSAAGFLSYEAAPAFDRAFVTHPRGRLPLLWFGLFHGPREMAELPDPEAPFSVGAWTPTVTRVAYAAAIRRIKRLIHAGDTYQVNYTLRLRAAFSGDPYALFHQLCRAQKAGCGAFISADDWAVCSASPELFFRLKGDRLLSRPMKGTAPRGLTREEDEDNASGLRQSAKNRAENVMIVDMVRNDLGRVALPGSVRVVRAFEIERYPTVLQMTSTVRARTTASFREILGALFPCASITGAPKVRTMQIIQEVETTPRGAYTGAAGYLLPGREAAFNVAIRTVVVDRRAGRAEYGVGGGWCGTREEAMSMRSLF